MLKSLKSNSYRFVVVLLLLLTFLTTGMVGKVIPSYALADPQPEFDPVYNTEIVRLADYVDNTLTPDQQDIFYIMFGAYVAAHGAMSEYHLEDPYTTKDGVLGWLKSTGIQLYNTLVDQMALMTPQFLIQRGINNVVDFALGIAQKAGLYTSYTNFTDHLESADLMLMPINKGIQLGINSIFAINGGLYEWQSNVPYSFENYFSWNHIDLTGFALSEWNNAINSLNTPRHFASLYGNSYKNAICSTINGVDKFDLFIDLDDHQVYFHDPMNYTVNAVVYNNYSSSVLSYSNATIMRNIYRYTASVFDNFYDLLDDVFMNDSFNSSSNLLTLYVNGSPFILNSQEFINQIYVGNDWESRQLWTPNMTLNFSDDNIVNYLQVQNDYLFDLKGLINDLINSVDLYDTLINNFFNPDGTLNINPSLIKVSIDLPVIDGTPALPVNLNDIAEYTDNEYLDVVKQRSLQASETIGEYVAFWHNCDSELVYAILGSFIVILIGAFIGKWGHS